METLPARRPILTRKRVASLLGILVVALLLVSASQWRGDAQAPAGVTHIDDARGISQTRNLALLPLRFVEAHVVPARCSPGYTLTVYVFEPALPFFGDVRSYAIAEFPPASCTGGDCGGAIVGASRDEYEAALAGGGASPCT
ncbi:MAG TPA: hypothetical protein VK656_00525 [Candidatus Acidoferrum sp.]|nr:hypothetical protein [Candidatus Acidoferrum sp.]